MQTYGYGWFWSPIGDGRSALIPPSTAYPTPPLDWWHPEGCAVERNQACNHKKEGHKTDGSEAQQ